MRKFTARLFVRCLALGFGVSLLAADASLARGDKGPSRVHSVEELRAATDAANRIAALVYVSRLQGAHIAYFANQRNVILIIRPVNKEAPDLRTKGHPPKPISIKYKTLGPLDAEIGGPPGVAAEGRVAVFRPHRPKQAGPEYLARYQQRLQEWKDANELSKQDPHPGDIVQVRRGESELQALKRLNLIYLSPTEDGLRFSVKEDEGGFVMSPALDKSYTGDVDLFEIRDGNSGHLTPDEKKILVKRLETDQQIDVMHGVHVDWDTHGDARYVDIDKRIRNKHKKESAGHEALIKVTPNFGVCQVWGPNSHEEDETHEYLCNSDAASKIESKPNRDPAERAKANQDKKLAQKPASGNSSPSGGNAHKPHHGIGALLWLSRSRASEPGACYRDSCEQIRITKVEESDYTYDSLDKSGKVVGSHTDGIEAIEPLICSTVTDRPE